MAKSIKQNPYSILIVDDAPDNLRLLAKILGDRGYRVRLAPSGAHALRTVEKESPDLILLDIRMPKMDGYEVCKRLKKEKAFRNIPVIYLSALDDVEDKVKAFKTGGVDYITKPFKEVEVLTRIKLQLELKTYREKLEQLVEARTEELQQTVQKLKTEISTRKKAEKELENKNTALQEILNHLEQERAKVKDELAMKIETMIMPTLKKIEMSCHSGDKKYFELLSANIKQVCDPFIGTFHHLSSKLSPQELEICQFMRNRLRNKDIADMLHISLNTVKWHRNNIRKKLRLTSAKENLASYLISSMGPNS